MEPQRLHTTVKLRGRGLGTGMDLSQISEVDMDLSQIIEVITIIPSQTNLPLIQAKVTKKPVIILLDSGAAISVTSQDFLDFLGLPLEVETEEENVVIKGVSGQVCRPVGSCQVEVEIDGTVL